MVLIVAAQVVCADGEIRTASAGINPDLFWAPRGGGGNFGIVASFTFRLCPLGPTVAFAGTFYPLEDLADIERRWRDHVVGAPDAVTSFVVSLTFPAAPGMPGRRRSLRRGSRRRDAGAAATARAGHPARPVTADALQRGAVLVRRAVPRGVLRAYWKSQYLDALTDDAIDAIAARALDRPGPMTLVSTFHIGGAVHAVGPEETAFAELPRRSWCRSTRCGRTRCRISRRSTGAGRRGRRWPSSATGTSS